jgi:hypothetical protein
MRSDLAALPALPDAALPSQDSELRRALLLARLLVDFDPILADDVRDHLEARADALERTGQAPSSRAEKARRFRALAALLESSGPARIYPRS